MVSTANFNQFPSQAATWSSNWNSFGAFGFAVLQEDLDLPA